MRYGFDPSTDIIHQLCCIGLGCEEHDVDIAEDAIVEIDRLRKALEKVCKERDMAISEIGKWARLSPLEDRWDNE